MEAAADNARARRDRRPLADGRKQLLGRLLPPVLLVALVLATFWRVLGHGFLAWDDEQNVVQNPFLNPPTLEGLARFWSEPFKGLYVPLSYTFLALEAWLSESLGDPPPGMRLDPAVFHAGNLVLHAACVLLVYALLVRWVRSKAAAGLGAALFAVHPVQVEPVAWVIETRGLLGSLLSLAALWFHGSFAREQGAGRARWLAYAAGTLCLALALLAKPAAAATPLIAWVVAVAFAQRRPVRAALELLPWIALAAAAGVWTKALQPASDVTLSTPLALRPLIAADALSFYLGKLAWPLGLAADYGRSPERVLQGVWVWFAWIPPVGLLAAALLLPGKRWPRLAALAIFVAGVAPVLGLVPFDYQAFSTVADRYLHLSMLGAALAGALALARWWSPATVGAAVVVLATLAGLSRRQAAWWENDLTLFTHSLAIQPESFAAHVNLGVFHQRRGRFVEAVEHFEHAAGLRPTDARASVNLALAYDRNGEPQRALEAYRRTLELQPGFAEAHSNLGEFWLRQGRPERALPCFERAVALGPRLLGARNNLALAQLQLGRVDEAVRGFREVLARDPRLPEAHLNLGRALGSLGRRPEALEHLRQALRLRPGYREAQQALAELGGTTP